MLNLFSKLREVSHSAIALVGATSASSGLVLMFLNSVGLHVSQSALDHDLLLAGGAAALLSKGIDSLNNALTSRGGIVGTVEQLAVHAAPQNPLPTTSAVSSIVPAPPPTQVPA